jgi:hypothetical protein
MSIFQFFHTFFTKSESINPKTNSSTSIKAKEPKPPPTNDTNEQQRITLASRLSSPSSPPLAHSIPPINPIHLALSIMTHRPPERGNKNTHISAVGSRKKTFFISTSAEKRIRKTLEGSS